MVVATFRGRFDNFDATLTVTEDGAELVGTVDASSIVVKDENLQGHLGSPDFFDIEHYPRAHASARRNIRRDGDELIVDGELTIKGRRTRVERARHDRRPRRHARRRQQARPRHSRPPSTARSTA